MDVNEEIAKEWLHLCKKQFTLDNIPFKVYGPKGGSNYSNIDLLAVDSENNYYDYEVKWRSVYSLSASDKETPEGFLHQMTRPERIEKIREIIGERSYKKILITTHHHFGKTEKKKNEFINFFNKHQIEVIFFEDIINELINQIKTNGRYDSPVLQVIRILKLFNKV